MAKYQNKNRIMKGKMLLIQDTCVQRLEVGQFPEKPPPGRGWWQKKREGQGARGEAAAQSEASQA